MSPFPLALFRVLEPQASVRVAKSRPDKPIVGHFSSHWKVFLQRPPLYPCGVKALSLYRAHCLFSESEFTVERITKKDGCQDHRLDTLWAPRHDYVQLAQNAALQKVTWATIICFPCSKAPMDSKA